MSLCNDLIGLTYGWGHRPGDGSGKTDCFQLMCEIHQRLGLKDYADDFDWVYRQYAKEGVPAIRLIRWLLQHARAAGDCQPGDVAMLPGTIAAAFATVSDVGGLVYISNRGRVVQAQTVPPNLKLYRPLP
jgi:hypothetical protein